MLKDILKLSKRLIKIESTKDKKENLRKALRVCLKELEGFNKTVFKDKEAPSTLIFNTHQKPKKFKILLNAHLDVVEGTKDQFKPHIKGNKLYGRGAYDMKSALAVELLVFKNLAHKLNYPIGLQLVTDEEIGGFKGTKYQLQQGVKADFVIAGEPTELDINNKAKGLIWAKFTLKGKTAHGAHPWQGKNALVKATNLIHKTLKKYPIPKKEEWKTTVNIAKIETNNKSNNVVPKQASVTMDIRYIPKDNKRILKFLNKLSKEFNANLELLLNEPHQSTPKNNIYVKKLAKATKKVIKKEPKIIVKHGGSDIRHFNSFGIQGVTFGPKGANLHAKNEWVNIKSLEQYYRALEEFLISLQA